ncbi:MAG TPA: hypothetical protein VJX69_08400 [Terriglobales bacterium]|nr:hypothetical protein [Terriglobales bacterium]
MIKNCLFAVALASLALAVGCATGGNGIVPPPPSVAVTITSPADVNAGAIYPTQTLTLTATVTNSTNTAVTWSLSPSGAGTLTPGTPPTTATYVAPATVPAAGSQPTITATLVSDTSVTGPLGLTIVDITTEVSPATLSVGKGLTQTFTAVAVPDDAPQTFTWYCTENGVQCASARFYQDANVSGLAYYTAPVNCGNSCAVQISAASTTDPTGCAANPNYCTIAKPSLVTYRVVNGTYAFQFSGYDSSNNFIAVIGTFTAVNGAITSGVEEVLTANGPSAQNPISMTGGSYTPTSSDLNNSNNAGTLTLTSSGVYPNQKYQVVLDGGGDIAMIESDGQGTGSGIAQKWPSANQPSLFTGEQTFAFGFTGVDFGVNRVGYVGLLPMNTANGSGTIASNGQMDVNDNGNATNICGAGPCSITGTYTADPNISGLYHMTLTPGAAAAMNFDFFISSGTTSKTNPLTFYAISTDPVVTHPAVSGTMVLQDSSPTYNNAAFKATSVSALTGTVTAANATCTAPPCTNVSLLLGTPDGNGNFSGQFDQNNAGTILSGVQFPGASQSPSPYTYAATGTPPVGRYTFNLLGNPAANPVQAPLPFVLYASGENRGFLLDQNSSSVMTGTMNPQGKIPCSAGFCALSTSELPGTYAAATTNSGSSTVSPIAANLLLDEQTPQTGPVTYNLSGTEYPPFVPPLQPVVGTYTLDFKGNGTFAPIAPATTPNYVIYVLGTLGCTGTNPACAVQSFLMMDEDTTNPYPSIIFAQQ